jgi:hypothetical protein
MIVMLAGVTLSARVWKPFRDTLVMPGGVRVEGASVETLTTLLRALR